MCAPLKLGGVDVLIEVWKVANVMVSRASGYASYITGEIATVSSQQP